MMKSTVGNSEVWVGLGDGGDGVGVYAAARAHVVRSRCDPPLPRRRNPPPGVSLIREALIPPPPPRECGVLRERVSKLIEWAPQTKLSNAYDTAGLQRWTTPATGRWVWGEGGQWG